MDIERRREGRVPLELSVSYSYLGKKQETHQSLTENVSTSGMCLKSNGHLREGASFQFLLGLPCDKKAKITGRVRWQSPQSGSPRVGIQFSEPVDFALPLSVVEQALHRSAEQVDLLLHRLYRSFGEGCAWVDSAGRITECDDGFCKLLGYSQEEVQGRALSDFAGAGDRKRLSRLLSQKRSDLSSSSKGLFRMQRKQGPSLLSRLYLPPGSPWKASTAICFEPIGEVGALFQEMNKLRDLYTGSVSKLVALREEKQQAEKILAAVKRSFPGWMLLLNRDLSIRDVACIGTLDTMQQGSASFFRGMPLGQATGLLETKLNGNSLCDELRACTETGREFMSKCCRYRGRSDKNPDLFPPGAFSITVNPIADLRGQTESLFMAVLPMLEAAPENEIDSESLVYVQRLLDTAAAGLTVQSVLSRMHNPFASLLARLNLFRYKLALAKMQHRSAPDPLGEGSAAELTKIEWQMERLAKQLGYLVEQASMPNPPQPGGADIKKTLSKVIHMVESADEPVDFSAYIGQPKAGISERDCSMIFMVFLLLARESVGRVSDKTVKCELKEEKGDLIVDIRHKGFISDPKYAEMLFDNDSPETLLLRHRPDNVLGTLLCYASLLLKKNHIKISINNVPGEFRLSLYLPVLEA